MSRLTGRTRFTRSARATALESLGGPRPRPLARGGRTRLPQARAARPSEYERLVLNLWSEDEDRGGAEEETGFAAQEYKSLLPAPARTT